ncbi:MULTISPECIES: STAS domain-containing protein [Actinokineospora]|nr:MULTISPECIES: STAS domain-containing protein [Actinokineospora]UVS80662.1 anti-anti-sigma factor [Actinokineospora sp. UTMC 2448]
MGNVSRSCVASTIAVDVLGTPDQPRVLVTGDVDALTVIELVEALADALRARPAALCVDLRSASFFGAAGLSALLSARETACGQDTRWRVLIADHSIVWRVVDVTGLAGELNAVVADPF